MKRRENREDRQRIEKTDREQRREIAIRKERQRIERGDREQKRDREQRGEMEMERSGREQKGETETETKIQRENVRVDNTRLQFRRK